MKKKFILASVFILSGILSSFATNIITSPESETKLHLIENSYTVLYLKNTISSINLENFSTINGTFTKIDINAYGKSLSAGNPELPVLKKLIEIPYGASIETEIVNSSFKDYNLNELGFNNTVVPARGPLSKNIDDPQTIEYILNSNAYSSNSFLGDEILFVESLGTMRGVNIARIEIAPVQYNPVSNTLRIYYELELKISFIDGDIPFTKASKKKYFSPFYENIYHKLINYKASDDKELINDSPATYVIVSDPMFHDNLQPFIEWKSKKGFRVITAYTDDPNVGNTTISIKSYLENLYNVPPEGYNPHCFILFVGDVLQIPVFSGTATGQTDLYYTDYTGDIYPECFLGRFSATNQEELDAQLMKTLEYEKYEFPEPAYLDSAMLIAGIASGYDTIWGSGQINYMANNYLNPENDIYSQTYLPPFNPDTSYSELMVQTINNGVSFVNYTGHCNFFGFSNPPLTIGNIPDLTNEHKYPLIVGNCCSAASFYTTCFGEILVRSLNKGALSFIGASDLTYWDEDYWWMIGFKEISANPQYNPDNLGLMDRWFHSHNETTNEWFITQGQMPVAGNLAITQSGSNLETYYWEVYNLLGDPSLMIYIPEPELPQVDYSPTIAPGTETFTVFTEPNLYAALSMNGVLHGASVSDENGIAEIDIFQVFTEPGIAEIIVTGQNIQPYMGTVMIENAEGPWVLLQYYDVDDSNGNNDGKTDAGENILLDITLYNFGNTASGNLTATISTADTNVNLMNTTNTWSSLDPGNSETNNGAFSFDVSQFCNDGHLVEFNIEISNNTITWNSDFTITLHSVTTEIPEIISSEPISNLKVFPNPFSNNINIDYELGNTYEVGITILDLVGTELINYRPTHLQSAGRHHNVLNTGNLPTGVYFCKIQSDSFSIIKRIILAR